MGEMSSLRECGALRETPVSIRGSRIELEPA